MAGELASGKDNIPDLLISTIAGHPNYAILTETNPADGSVKMVDHDSNANTPDVPSFKSPLPIGEQEADTRAIKVGNFNNDALPDVVVANYDTFNYLYLADPTRPGDFTYTQAIPFGDESDKSMDPDVVEIPSSSIRTFRRWSSRTGTLRTSSRGRRRSARNRDGQLGTGGGRERGRGERHPVCQP